MWVGRWEGGWGWAERFACARMWSGSVRVCACVCVRARVHACAPACVRACVLACVHPRVFYGRQGNSNFEEVGEEGEAALSISAGAERVGRGQECSRRRTAGRPAERGHLRSRADQHGLFLLRAPLLTLVSPLPHRAPLLRLTEGARANYLQTPRARLDNLSLALRVVLSIVPCPLSSTRLC